LRCRTGVTAPVSSGGHDEARQGEVHDPIGFKKGGAHQVLDGNLQRKGGGGKTCRWRGSAAAAARSLAERTPRHDGQFTTHGEHEHNDTKVGPERVNGRGRDPTADRRQGDEVPRVKGVAFTCKGARPRVLWVVVARSLQEEATRRSGNGGFGGSSSIATHLGGTRRRWCHRAT
jgi:hypothetical protein